jgi:hypothetical protein
VALGLAGPQARFNLPHTDHWSILKRGVLFCGLVANKSGDTILLDYCSPVVRDVPFFFWSQGTLNSLAGLTRVGTECRSPFITPSTYEFRSLT